MPAGSPAVTTSGCVDMFATAGSSAPSDAGFDERLVADAPYPQFRFVRELAVANALDTVRALEILGIVVNAAVRYFEDMPAKNAS